MFTFDKLMLRRRWRRRMTAITMIRMLMMLMLMVLMILMVFVMFMMLMLFVILMVLAMVRLIVFETMHTFAARMTSKHCVQVFHIFIEFHCFWCVGNFVWIFENICNSILLEKVSIVLLYKIKVSRYIYIVVVEYVIVIHAAHTQKAKSK
jgi:hypothetical protein